MQFFANSIQKASSMNLLIPERPGPWATLYLLHGLSDDHTMWQRRTSIERYVEGTRLLVVMPDGHRNFYVNDPRPGGMAYEDHIVRDVRGFVERTFPVVRSRRGRAIAGLSMGGYGAMMLGLKHAGLFSVISAHSGAFGLLHMGDRRPQFADLLASLSKTKYDCASLARALKRSGRKVAIRFDCGTDDGLIDRNRALHAQMEKVHLAHEYAEYPGGHNWAYWDEHIRETLAFVKVNLKAKV